MGHGAANGANFGYCGPHEGSCSRRVVGMFPRPLTAWSPTGKVVCEEPNGQMHHFVGCLEWKGKKYPLDSGNILLRGSKIRNTDACYGLAIYAGAPQQGPRAQLS